MSEKGCRFYDNKLGYCNCNLLDNGIKYYCEEETNCYYKQLQALQERIGKLEDVLKRPDDILTCINCQKDAEYYKCKTGCETCDCKSIKQALKQ